MRIPGAGIRNTARLGDDGKVGWQRAILRGSGRFLIGKQRGETVGEPSRARINLAIVIGLIGHFVGCRKGLDLLEVKLWSAGLCEIAEGDP